MIIAPALTLRELSDDSATEWDRVIDTIVAKVKEAFAIEKRMTWQLYKLLVYEPGSFFLPHRDSEKQNGMIATLVVCLPSRREGGSLIVQVRCTKFNDLTSGDRALIFDLDRDSGEFQISPDRSLAP